MIPAQAVEAAARAIYAEGAYCGNCEYAGWESCADCRDCCTSYAKAAAPHVMAEFRSELVKLAQEFDSAEGGTLAYTAKTDDGRFVMRKNAHDQLMYVIDNHASKP